MGSMMVVAVQLVGLHVTHLRQVVEHAAVEHFGAVGLVDSLDRGVLRGFARLDVLQGDALALSPQSQCVGDELRAVVNAQWLPATAGSKHPLDRRLPKETTTTADTSHPIAALHWVAIGVRHHSGTLSAIAWNTQSCPRTSSSTCSRSARSRHASCKSRRPSRQARPP